MKYLLYGLIGLLVLAGAFLGFAYMQLTKQPAPLEQGMTVTIAQGQLQGGHVRDAPSIQQFNGIPFATAARWSPPGPAAAWGDSVRDARDFSAECMQPRDGLDEFIADIVKGMGLPAWKQQAAKIYMSAQPVPPESEDCLHLNIRTANAGSDELRPVMVWIHGGSHQTGAGSQGLYQADGLVENGVVLVTINYRLGPFGYMAHPALTAEQGASGNYGLMDQIAALEWVQGNISAFGGDPSNVTIFGESAGAQSVTEIMAAPSGDGLYQKAIAQSGASSYNMIHLQDAPIEGMMSAEAVGASFLEMLAPAGANADDLRAIPADAIVAEMAKRQDIEGYWLPNVDGKILPETIGEQTRDGGMNHVPMLLGFNADEATLFYPSTKSPTVLETRLDPDIDGRIAVLKKHYGEPGGARLAELYGLADPATHDDGATDMLGDDVFGVHMRYLARANTRADKPTYAYFFTQTPSSPKQTLGAFHAAEISYVFNSHTPLVSLTPEDQRLTDAMGIYWTNFAKAGNPNGNGAPDWPAYADGNWMELGKEIKPIRDLRKEKLDLIEVAVNARIDIAAPLTPRETLIADSGGEETVANRD